MIKWEPTRLIPTVEHDFRTIGFIEIDTCWLLVLVDVSWWAVVDDSIGKDDKMTVDVGRSQAGIRDRFVGDEIFNCSSKAKLGARVYLRV
jgi:hypothetical protein